MEFKKERNFIVAYDCSVKMGAWNISDGSFVGKSGKPVKGVPNCFTYNNLPIYCERSRNESSFFGYTIRKYREWRSEGYFEYNNNRGNRFEQLLSVGLFPCGFSDLDNSISLTKELVNYLKETNRGIFSTDKVHSYLLEKKYNEFLSDKPEWAKVVFVKLISNDFPYDYLKTIINRTINEHVDSFFGSYCVNEMFNLIKRYYEICMQLYGKVEIKPNVLSNYAHLRYLEIEYKNTHYNEVLEKNNNKPWLYFENETFLVRPLLTKNEFHEEGERQNNCVERMYMERVYKGSTHVVVVRRMENPDKNYITCEVSNNGRIVQYLTKNNSRNMESDARLFETLYQDYLYTVTKD